MPLKTYEISHEDFSELEMTIEVDEEKFSKVAKDINEFWGDADWRKLNAGSHEKAALKMFAAQCFQLVAFNNFLGADYVTDEFNWEKNGVEGYPSLPDMGIKIIHLESWFVESDSIEIKEKANA